MEENKDTKKNDAITDEELDEIFEDTDYVFHRESDTIVGSDKSRRPGEAPGNTGNSGSPGNTGISSIPRIPVSSPRQNSIPPEMQSRQTSGRRGDTTAQTRTKRREQESGNVRTASAAAPGTGEL